jgi:hypothetical protein
MSCPYPLRQVYVEIPPSPLHTRPHISSTSALKENTPFRLAHGNMQGSTSHKRKLVPSDATPMPSPKKSKTLLEPSAKPRKSGSVHPPKEELPNGWENCHQCGQKRDPSGNFSFGFPLGASERAQTDIVVCTFLCAPPTKKPTRRRCGCKFCKTCLRNRYAEDINAIKSSSPGEPGHFEGEKYTFKYVHSLDSKINAILSLVQVP